MNRGGGGRGPGRGGSGGGRGRANHYAGNGRGGGRHPGGPPLGGNGFVQGESSGYGGGRNQGSGNGNYYQGESNGSNSGRQNSGNYQWRGGYQNRSYGGNYGYRNNNGGAGFRQSTGAGFVPRRDGAAVDQSLIQKTVEAVVAAVTAATKPTAAVGAGATVPDAAALARGPAEVPAAGAPEAMATATGQEGLGLAAARAVPAAGVAVTGGTNLAKKKKIDVCFRCKQPGHFLDDCTAQVCDICESIHHITSACNLLQAPKPQLQMYGYANEALMFFELPWSGSFRPKVENAKVARLAIEGDPITIPEIIEQLKWIVPSENFQWEVNHYHKNIYKVKFPNKNEVQRMKHFRTYPVPGKLTDMVFDDWGNVEEPAYMLPEVWVRVSGLPTDVRGDFFALWAVGYLFGKTVEVDMAFTRKNKILRIKIGCLDSSLIPQALDIFIRRGFYKLEFEVETVRVTQDNHMVDAPDNDQNRGDGNGNGEDSGGNGNNGNFEHKDTEKGKDVATDMDVEQTEASNQQSMAMAKGAGTGTSTSSQTYMIKFGLFPPLIVKADEKEVFIALNFGKIDSIHSCTDANDSCHSDHNLNSFVSKSIQSAHANFRDVYEGGRHRVSPQQTAAVSRHLVGRSMDVEDSSSQQTAAVPRHLVSSGIEGEVCKRMCDTRVLRPSSRSAKACGFSVPATIMVTAGSEEESLTGDIPSVSLGKAEQPNLVINSSAISTPNEIIGIDPLTVDVEIQRGKLGEFTGLTPLMDGSSSPHQVLCDEHKKCSEHSPISLLDNSMTTNCMDSQGGPLKGAAAPSLEEVIAFGGISNVSQTKVRSSARIRAQPDADDTILEKAMKLQQRHDHGMSGIKSPSKLSFVSISNADIIDRASRLGVSLGKNLDEAVENIRKMKGIEEERSLVMLQKNDNKTNHGMDAGPSNLSISEVSALCEDLVEDELEDIDLHDLVTEPLPPIKEKKRRQRKIYDTTHIRRSDRKKTKKNY
jgi:hypothetical protein